MPGFQEHDPDDSRFVGTFGGRRGRQNICACDGNFFEVVGGEERGTPIIIVKMLPRILSRKADLNA